MSQKLITIERAVIPGLVILFLPSHHFIYAVGIKPILLDLANLFSSLVGIIISLAVLFFIYGLTRLMLSAGNPEERQKGYNIMIYGVISLFVIVSVWGLVAILQHTVGTSMGSATVFPAPWH